MGEFILTSCKSERKRDRIGFNELESETLTVEVKFLSSGNTTDFSIHDINQEIMKRLQTLTDKKE